MKKQSRAQASRGLRCDSTAPKVSARSIMALAWAWRSSW
ncbi:Uncharacterised protein [Mycobacterium tuberculosis]|nr:Uncharacterised protein [Mycobacterium tuberculosis]